MPHRTLRAWYAEIHRPLFQPDARPRTIEAYTGTLSAWEALTSNPPLSEITNETVANFRATCLASGMTASTTNKHLRHICAVLAKAGPPERGNRDALGAIAITPWARPLRTHRQPPKAASLGAVAATYAAGDAYWQALIAVALHTGTRIDALTRLRADEIDWHARIANFPAETDKCHCTRRKPLSQVAMTHLARIARAKETAHEALLAWPHSRSHFYVTLRQLQTRANVPDTERWTPHDLKRLCGTLLARGGASPWAVRHMLDHSQTDVTGAYYIDPLDELREHVERLPDPAGNTGDGLRIVATA